MALQRARCWGERAAFVCQYNTPFHTRGFRPPVQTLANLPPSCTRFNSEKPTFYQGVPSALPRNTCPKLPPPSRLSISRVTTWSILTVSFCSLGGRADRDSARCPRAFRDFLFLSTRKMPSEMQINTEAPKTPTTIPAIVARFWELPPLDVPLCSSEGEEEPATGSRLAVRVRARCHKPCPQTTL